MKKLIDLLQDRGFVQQMSCKGLSTHLDTPLSFYLGIDPTAPSIHLGTLVGLIVSKWLQNYGHRPVILLGGATGLIGDPSGKSKERVLLDEQSVAKNVDAIKSILTKFLDFNHSTAPPLIVDNHSWYAKMNVIEFLRDIGKQFRLGPMLGKESVRLRLDTDEGMSFTEFAYQTLQAYDFYHLYTEYNVTLQIGGSDQYGNITAGIDYVRRRCAKEVYGFTFPLLTRSDGKKFGKTEEGTIWLTEECCSVYQFYQHLVRTPDADTIHLMKQLTFMSMDEIDEIEKSMQGVDYQANSAQKRLASEITKIVHGLDGVKRAEAATAASGMGDATIDAKALKLLANEIPSKELKKEEVVGKSFVDLSVLAGLISSKGEARRLILGGGARVNRKKIIDVGHLISEEELLDEAMILLGAGKKKQLLITIS